MRALTMALLLLTILAVAFAGAAGSSPTLQVGSAPRVRLAQLSDVPTDTVEAKVWLPEIATNWPVPVRAGIWRDERDVDRAKITFTVTADRKLCNFRHNTLVCGMGGFKLDGCTGIAADGSVSFDANIRYTGRFRSPTELRGEWFFISPRCVRSGVWSAFLMEE